MREFDQRLAVVGKQDLGRGKWGLWVELKTTEGRGGARIERGFYAPASLRGSDLLPGGDGSDLIEGMESRPPNEPPPSTALPENPGAHAAGEFVLLRYQVLTPGGKLYEYPVGSTRHARAAGDVATFELFEYDPAIRPLHSTVGPDTLVLGRRLVPAVVDQTVRHGTDRWPLPGDESREAHLVLTQRFWRNPAVPLTGYARSVFQAEVMPVDASVPAGADSGAAADSAAVSAAGAAPPDSAAAGDGAPATAASPDSVAAAPDSAAARPPAEAGHAPGTDVLAWTELTLVDLGADARPEVNQEPEVPPDVDAEEVDPSGYQR